MARESCSTGVRRYPDSKCSQDSQANRLRIAALNAPAAVSSLGQRRGEILRGLFPKLASWMETEAERIRRSEIEGYLWQATTLSDLEQRVRRLERGSGLSLFH